MANKDLKEIRKQMFDDMEQKLRDWAGLDNDTLILERTETLSDENG